MNTIILTSTSMSMSMSITVAVVVVVGNRLRKLNTAEAGVYITKLSWHTDITINTQLSVPAGATMKWWRWFSQCDFYCIWGLINDLMVRSPLQHFPPLFLQSLWWLLLVERLWLVEASNLREHNSPLITWIAYLIYMYMRRARTSMFASHDWICAMEISMIPNWTIFCL